MSLGLESAYGAQGAAEALRQLIKDRLEREQLKQRMALELRSADRADRQLDQTDAFRRDQMEERRAIAEATAADRRMGVANKLGDQVPAGMELPLDSPTVKPLQSVGLLKGNMTLPSTQTAGGMTMPGDDGGSQIKGTLRSISSPETVRSYTKLPSEKQTVDATTRADKLADNDRQQKNLERQTAADKARERYQEGMLNKPAAGRETFEEWKRKQDYEREHPKAGAAGGSQGLQRARADAATQMLDRLQAVHAQLQAGEGPGQLVSGTVNKVKGMLNMSNPATEYQKLRKATAVALAVAIQGSRPSDADAEAMAALLPDYNTPGEVARNLFKGTRAQLAKTAEAMGGQTHPSAGGSKIKSITEIK